MSSANVDLYGPVADAAASKYGLDTGMFRRLISSESSFNPTAINTQAVNGEHASGIAQFLPSTAASFGIDPFDPYASLDGAAKYLSDLGAKYGLSAGIAKYKGYSNPNSSDAVATSNKILGVDENSNFATIAGDTNVTPKPADTSGNDKPFWKYTFSDFKAMFQSAAWGLTFSILGLLIIGLSVYMLVKNSGTDSMGAVKKMSGI